MKLGTRAAVGDIEATYLLRDLHFFRSGPDRTTIRQDEDIVAVLIALLGNFYANPSEESLATFGTAIHTFADTWSHEGFTAWNNKNINGRGGALGTIFGYVGHTDAGETPDVPSNDVSKAIEAARSIYVLMPKGDCCSLTLSDIESEMRTGFSFKGSEEARAENWRKIIKKRFGEDVEVFR
jgi:hypothetical protein